VLLDTHVFLWWSSGAAKLSRDARAAIAHADAVFVSAASAWEAAIKAALGRLKLDDSFATMVEDNRFHELAVSMAHAERLHSLPAVHGDPFDRMLAAQALAERLTLITHDDVFEKYGVKVIWT
jgi:PIN domain nuclease of toxin-antitoxin system